MKVINISTFVALAALVHSSSAVSCQCYTKKQGTIGTIAKYNSKSSEKCCKDVMNAELNHDAFPHPVCDVEGKSEEYKKCCKSSDKGFGGCGTQV